MTHSEVGAWLCEKWNIRADIVDIVAFHHTPFLSKTMTDELKLIHLADVISTIYYEKLLGVNINHNLNTRLMESLGVTREMMDKIGNQLPDEVEKANYHFVLDV
ncbi:HDOD domain-containing protein [Alkaliphilus metalliredigens]|uniref:HDOD domain-containing protein n=1 Tax=Alkaliphilus metalliredigens TaxID=208226 RepID=UPI00005CAD39|nr:HDOD domain-containing protein [Alkaliphilus metalliredigens]